MIENSSCSFKYSSPERECRGSMKALRGEVLSFEKDPFLYGEAESVVNYKDGMVVINDGKIVAAGDYSDMSAAFPMVENIETYDDSVIMPGFVDCHLHYVQSPMIASAGDTLLAWLEQYTFPTEAKFRNKEFADEVAKIFFRQLLMNGTTTANIFATTFPESVDAIFEESERYNARTICGKVLQDRNLPDNLKDKTAEGSVVESERLLNKWHSRGRQLYSVVPRFAPTSSRLQLKLAGELFQKYKGEGVYMHTHLNEAENEIEWVRQLYPEAANYTDVYASNGLLGERSVFAHCCLMKEEEWQMLHDHGCGIAHCPSSNLFLGDGQFKYWEAKDARRACKVGIGTDVGGGTDFSVLRQLGDAYKVAMLHDRYLSGVRSLYMATRGGAEVLGLEDKIGSISAGYEADIAVIDLKPTEFIEWRLRFAEDIFSKLFVLQTMGVGLCVNATYVAGNKVYSK